MLKVISEEDLIVVPVSYFNGMELQLQEMLNKIEIHDMDTMEQILQIRKWLNAKTVNEEMRRLYPELNWNNIRLLLPQEENCSCSCKKGTDSEQIPQSNHRKESRKSSEHQVPSKSY